MIVPHHLHHLQVGSGFWTVNLDSVFWSLAMGVLGVAVALWPELSSTHAPGSTDRLLSIVAAGLYPQIAYCMILYLTGLNNLRPDLIEAARLEGAKGWKMLWHVTLPNVKWGLIYGVILTNARAMGEFGAVSVVSGHIRGQTNTMPLHVEILYNEYQSVAAFAVASLLALLALVTLVIKSVVEWRHEREMKLAADAPPERPLQVKEAV